MARNLTIRHIRTTRANLNTKVSASELLQGEIYLITDENRIAIGLSVNTYEVYSKLSEIPVIAIGSELDTGTNNTKVATPKALKDSKYQLIHIGTTAPEDTTILWLDTN